MSGDSFNIDDADNMSHEYGVGHCDPWWDDQFKNLNYIYYPLKNTWDVENWQRNGYTSVTLNGGLYNMSQPMPSYADPFFTLFDWKNVGIGFYCMKTCELLPLHSDHYLEYKKRFDLSNSDDVYRAVVFLEDWKSGHYFEIAGKGFINWSRGDYVWWRNGVPHFAGNIGTEPRYTMQITGTKYEKD